ncbi:MAG: hypothetical protein AMXMBFR16_13330 [Candidatus Uhrbacteria bacterium]
MRGIEWQYLIVRANDQDIFRRPYRVGVTKIVHHVATPKARSIHRDIKYQEAAIYNSA